MTAVYNMQALENFDQANQVLVHGGQVNTTPFNQLSNTDNQVVGTAFDFARNKIMYVAFNGLSTDGNAGDYLNTSGFTRWDGTQSFAPGASMNLYNNLSPYIGEKDVNTNATVWYPTYNSTKICPTSVVNAWTGLPVTLPAGCRRIARDYAPSGGNNPVVVNPHPGANQSDLFVHSESCELYQYRYRDNFAQVISPYIYQSGADPASSPMVRMFALDTTWTYNIVTKQGTVHAGDMLALLIIPTAITSDEVTYDSKLAYAKYTDSDATLLDDLGVRTVLGTDGDLYLLSIYADADSELNFRLTQFTPPAFSTYIPGSNIAGGSFTDVTPWDATSGPNLDGENYVTTTRPKPSWFSYLSFFRLPAGANKAVGIFKFLKEQLAGGSTDYTKTFFSSAVITLGASPTYVYSSAFVKGFMTTVWATAGSIPVTGYAVLNYRELDTYLDQTDYVYPGVNFNHRWLYWDVYPVVGSTVITAGGSKVVMTQYDLSTSPPTLLQMIDESGWDTTYADYGSAIGKTYVVENSLYQDQSISDFGYIGLMRDVGITLGTDALPVWWWSGQVDPNLDTASNNVFLLNPAFSARAALNAPTNGGAIITNLDAPFLRLAYGPAGSLAPWPVSPSPPSPGGTWATRTRKWLRSWRAHPQAQIHSQRYNVLEIDMEPGVAPAGSNPQVVLRYTDDAHTWSSEHYAQGGVTGDYGARVRFRRLGMERRGLSSDRVFELSGTDTAKIILLGADVS